MHDASGGNYWQSDSDPRGWQRSPLHVAALEGHREVVELLLAHGAEVNAMSKYGDTPLHFAITHRNVDVATALYKAGADVNIENDDGDTATSLGAKVGLNFGEDVRRPLYSRVLCPRLAITGHSSGQNRWLLFS